MNNLTVFLLDVSQSMRDKHSIWNATIEGFNKFLSVQQMQADDAAMYYAQFNDDVRPIAEFTPMGEVAPIDAMTYYPYGGTLMYDAITKTFKRVDDFIKALPVNERPVRVTFVIQTVGADAAPMADVSINVTKPWIALEITKRTADGWRFVFLGCDDFSIVEAQAMGFPPATTIRYDGANAQAFEDASVAIIESLITGTVTV